MSWPEATTERSGPYAGLRVLDLSRILAGPYAGTLLGDLGADVIKVERPVGDETRRWGPPFRAGDAAYYFTANRNRRAISLDLKDPDDQAIARALARQADVLIENFLPGVMERFDLAPDALRAENPKLVHCTIAGYGDEGRRGWPALDFVIQAFAGVMRVTGTGAEPLKAGVPLADMAAGLFATIGIQAALVEASRTGCGCHVEVALADACLCMLANQAMNWLAAGVEPRARGNAHPSIAPYQTVEAMDRPVALAATSEAQFRALCAVLGRDDLVADPRFADNAERVAHREALEGELERSLADAPAGEWVEKLNRAGVAAAVINHVGEALDDSGIAGRLVVSPTEAEGDRDVPQVRCPISFDGELPEARTAPPRLGANDDLKEVIAMASAPVAADQ